MAPCRARALAAACVSRGAVAVRAGIARTAAAAAMMAAGWAVVGESGGEVAEQLVPEEPGGGEQRGGDRPLRVV